jgi:hypothetical protein
MHHLVQHGHSEIVVNGNDLGLRPGDATADLRPLGLVAEVPSS